MTNKRVAEVRRRQRCRKRFVVVPIKDIRTSDQLGGGKRREPRLGPPTRIEPTQRKGFWIGISAGLWVSPLRRPRAYPQMRPTQVLHRATEPTLQQGRHRPDHFVLKLSITAAAQRERFERTEASKFDITFNSYIVSSRGGMLRATDAANNLTMKRR